MKTAIVVTHNVLYKSTRCRSICYGVWIRPDIACALDTTAYVNSCIHVTIKCITERKGVYVYVYSGVRVSLQGPL